MGFRGLLTFHQKWLISQGTSWESAHGHPVTTRLTLSCTREFAGVGAGWRFANPKAWPHPRGSLWGGTQVSEIFIFLLYHLWDLISPIRD